MIVYAPLLTVYTVLKAETETCMRLLGVERVEQLGLQHVSLVYYPFAIHLRLRILMQIDQHASCGERRIRWSCCFGKTEPDVAADGEAVNAELEHGVSVVRFFLCTTGQGAVSA